MTQCCSKPLKLNQSYTPRSPRVDAKDDSIPLNPRKHQYILHSQQSSDRHIRRLNVARNLQKNIKICSPSSPLLRWTHEMSQFYSKLVKKQIMFVMGPRAYSRQRSVRDPVHNIVHHIMHQTPCIMRGHPIQTTSRYEVGTMMCDMGTKIVRIQLK